MTFEEERVEQVLTSAQKHIDESKKLEAEMTAELSTLRLIGRVVLAAGGVVLASAFGVLGAIASFDGARVSPEAPFIGMLMATPPFLCAGYLGISSWELGKESINKLKTGSRVK